MSRTKSTLHTTVAKPHGTIIDCDADTVRIRTELQESFFDGRFAGVKAILKLADYSVDFSELQLITQFEGADSEQLSLPASAVVNQVAILLLDLFKDLQEIENREAMKNETND